VQKKEEIFSSILPDFADLPSERKMTEVTNQSFNDINNNSINAIPLDLPNISFEHLKGMSAFSTEELMKERA